MKSSFIAISFCKTRCLPTAGFVLHPPKSLSSGPHQGVMRLDPISSLKFVEPAQGAHAVRRKRRRWTRHFKQHSKLKTSARSRFTDTIPNGSQKPCGHAYRLVTLMTTSTSPTRIHLSGMSSKKPCAKMSLEISETICTCIAISFFKTRCLPDSGFCFTPSEITFFGASPRRHAPRFHFIAEICGTGAGGACGEEETATTNSSLQTTLKTKKRVRDRALPTRSRTVHKSLAATLTVLSP